MTIKDMGQNVSSDLDARPLSLTLHRNRTQISFILIFFLFFFLFGDYSEDIQQAHRRGIMKD